MRARVPASRGAFSAVAVLPSITVAENQPDHESSSRSAAHASPVVDAPIDSPARSQNYRQASCRDATQPVEYRSPKGLKINGTSGGEKFLFIRWMLTIRRAAVDGVASIRGGVCPGSPRVGNSRVQSPTPHARRPARTRATSTASPRPRRRPRVRDDSRRRVAGAARRSRTRSSCIWHGTTRHTCILLLVCCCCVVRVCCSGGGRGREIATPHSKKIIPGPPRLVPRARFFSPYGYFTECNGRRLLSRSDPAIGSHVTIR